MHNFLSSAAKIPHLARDVVHIWCLPLDLPQQEQERCLSLLAPDEKTRAEKFYFEKARDHFIAGRGLLRTLLGGYLKMEPAHLQLGYEPQGKPVLQGNLQNLPIQFNISHSEGLGVFALSLDHRVGVDIECVRPMADLDDLAQHFFTAKESALISSLSGNRKQELFYKIWTCKEAYLKAVGAGLFIPLDQIEVKFEADGSVCLISHDGMEMNDWQSHLFSPQVNYQCAVCVEGNNVEIVFQPSGQ
jgi:4'-phosphopantetheinyl transferase